MLATEEARVESWQLGLSLKRRRRRPNSRIVRGSCPAQVGSKKTRLAVETRFQRQRNRPQVSGRARLAPFRSTAGSVVFHQFCQEEGLNDRVLSRNRYRI